MPSQRTAGNERPKVEQASYGPWNRYGRNMTTLPERLGYPPDAKLLILNCDGLGLSHASNVAVFECLRNGLATSATLMVPCPWAREAASAYRGEDIGLDLTLNAEHDLYRWGPITHAPSLLDGDGGFPRTVLDTWDHADLDETLRECRAQIERAIYWGFDISHLSSHMGALYTKAEFFDIYLSLAVEFSLPARLPSADLEQQVGFPFRRLAADEGVVSPDHLIAVPTGDGSRRVLSEALLSLKPGVTEGYVCPSADTPELHAINAGYQHHIDDHELLVSDESFRGLLESTGAQLIGYKELRSLMRA